MRRLQRLCRNLSDGQKKSELTVEIRREYNKKQEILPEKFTEILVMSVKKEPGRKRSNDSRRKKNVSR